MRHEAHGIDPSVREPGRLPQISLSSWERGIKIARRDSPHISMFLWFYEWNMFGAIEQGQHTAGIWDNAITVRGDGTAATIVCESGLKLDLTAVDDGAEMTLDATNRSANNWPDLAAIIPCFSPGPPEKEPNMSFVNTRTFFLSEDGLRPLHIETLREMHYNSELRAMVARESEEDTLAWADKWPASKVDATAGLVVRQSTDGDWSAGIAWERYLSCQGHNPWHCMHLSIRLGPLRRGESRTVRGKMYLFKGAAAEVLGRYERDVANVRPRDSKGASNASPSRGDV